MDNCARHLIDYLLFLSIILITAAPKKAPHSSWLLKATALATVKTIMNIYLSISIGTILVRFCVEEFLSLEI